MALEPHWRHVVRTFTPWFDPTWRRQRSPERRALAWAATGGSLTCYLLAFIYVGAEAGSTVTALYAFPCVIAGWAFGASGGLMVALLSAPLHVWLFASGVVTDDTAPYGLLFGVLSATLVGVSVGSARDLRERLREHGAELAASEDRYRQLVDNSPEGVLVHERGVIVFANPSMATLTGARDAGALVGRTLVNLAPFEDREALATNFIFAMPDARGPRCVAARIVREGREPLDVVMTTMPIRYRGARANLVLVREAALMRAPAPLPAARVPATAR
ncbi:MAG TPA: PAS domain-containing protein [Candidatus Thermoplasmatota archaeon]|nr:PAS domain-containing protein [Candidatus Thermoplasmatota archaeon]